LKLPRLERIAHRADLEEAVCTTALADGEPKHLSRFYETTHPESSIDEVKKIANSGDFTVTQKGKSVPRFVRYSVAVWRVRGGSQQATYWVGLGFYGAPRRNLSTAILPMMFTTVVCGRNQLTPLVVGSDPASSCEISALLFPSALSRCDR
jgi:hypothetical protein